MRRIRCLLGDKEPGNRLFVDGDDILGDIGRLWNGCYVMLDGVNYNIASVNEWKDTPVFTLMGINPLVSTRAMLVSIEHPDLRLQYPTMGYFNMCGVGAAYFNKRVSRQWKRGVHDVNISYNFPHQQRMSHNMGQNIYGAIGVRTGSYGYGLGQALSQANIFAPTYYSYTDSVSSIRSNKSLSRALSNELALAVHPANGEIQVLYHELLVGVVEDDNTVSVRSEFNWLSDTIQEATHA